jgi:hypothetical protein
MPTMTLAEFQKRTKDELVAGVVEDIYSLNPLYSVLPWYGYKGSGVTVNRETTLGDAQILALGADITAKSPSAVDPFTFRATTVIGDTENNGLLVAESGSDVNDLEAMEISSKAKAVGRIIQAGIVGTSGDAGAALLNSFHTLIDSEQYVTNVTTGAVLTLEMLDLLLAKVDSKDGSVDFIMMSQRELIKLKALYRALGGTSAEWVVTLPDGRTTIGYEGIPVFVNRYLSTSETDDGAALTGGSQSSIYAGNWDDGTKKVGCSMIYPEATEAGIQVENIGKKELKDESIWRVKSYCNFAIFNRRGLARLTGIKAG